MSSLNQPKDAVCEECLHEFHLHILGDELMDDCRACGPGSGLSIESTVPIHHFKPIRYAGGAVTPNDEIQAYLRAMSEK